MGTHHETINYEDPSENQQPRRPKEPRHETRRVLRAMRRDAETSFREGDVEAMLHRLDDVEFYVRKAGLPRTALL